MRKTRLVYSEREIDEEHDTSGLADVLLRREDSASTFTERMNNIVSNMLRKEGRVRNFAKRFDGFVDMAREHKVIGALSLLVVDLPVACPAAIGAAVRLYNITLTPKVLISLEILDTMVLFGIEYSIVKGAIATYDKVKHHFLSRNDRQDVTTA